MGQEATKKGKGFHIYIKDPTLAEIFDAINEERGELSAAITELAWNGMEEVIGKRLKKRTAAVKKLRMANNTLKNVKKLRKSQKGELFTIYCKRIKDSPFELDHKANLSWIGKYAERLGMRPEVLLSELEKKYEKGKERADKVKKE